MRLSIFRHSFIHHHSSSTSKYLFFSFHPITSLSFSLRSFSIISFFSLQNLQIIFFFIDKFFDEMSINMTLVTSIHLTSRIIYSILCLFLWRHFSIDRERSILIYDDDDGVRRRERRKTMDSIEWKLMNREGEMIVLLIRKRFVYLICFLEDVIDRERTFLNDFYSITHSSSRLHSFQAKHFFFHGNPMEYQRTKSQ